MLIVALITIGLISLMTILTYYLEQQAQRRQRPLFTHAVHALEGASVLGSMLLLRTIFTALNSGSTVSWAYATAQLTVLLFSLNTMRNLTVEIINLLMPLFIYGQSLMLGYNAHYASIFILMTLILSSTIIYISHHHGKILSSNWRYLLIQFIYGGTWWFIIWSIHRFELQDTINVVLIFIVYMALIRICVQRLDHVFNEFMTMDQHLNYDELTGVRNRASFDTVTNEVFASYRTKVTVPVTMAMFDIDHFKQFNDQYGHLAGDAVLRHVAHFFELTLNQQNSHGELFRYGGEEFVVLFRGQTAADASKMMQALRVQLANTPIIFNGNELHVTVSMGVSALSPTDATFTDWFVRVDDYLYQAKQAGRNRLTTEGQLQV